MYVDSSNRIRYCYNDCNKESKKKISNEVKTMLLQSGLYDLWRNRQKALYYQTKLSDALAGLIDCDIDNLQKQFSKYQKFLDADLSLTDLELKCCSQLFNARRQRVLRLKKRLRDKILNSNCIFLTLTFTDKVLHNTSSHTRRRYINRWLKSLYVPFAVANIDFGDKDKNPLSKEREHYHAIVESRSIDLASYPYGIINAERIVSSDISTSKLSKYINKLSYHAYKDSTGYCNLIYLKPQKKVLQLSI